MVEGPHQISLWDSWKVLMSVCISVLLIMFGTLQSPKHENYMNEYSRVNPKVFIFHFFQMTEYSLRLL